MTTLVRVLALALFLPPAAGAQSLIISEYIEGSSNNKALEILNVSGGAFDLGAGQVVLQLYTNGSSTVSQSAALTGVLADGDVFVLANPSASPAILAQADVTNGSVINFNGDDALVLRVGGATGTVVDVIGQVGVDPGTEWGTGLASTADNTLVRKGSSCTGVTNPADAFDPATDYDGFATDYFDNLGLYTGTCAGGGGDTVVQFSPASATVGEAAGTATLNVAIANPSDSEATTFDVVFLSADPGTTGDGTDIGGFTTVPVSAAAGAVNAVVDVTVTDDGDQEPTETFVFQIQNVAGGTNAGVGAQDTFVLSISDNDTPVNDFVVINEVDSDQTSTDTAEFIELFDGGAGGTALDGIVVVLVNGNGEVSYDAFDLDGYSTDSSGLFVIGNPGVPGVGLEIPSGSIQNGPDAVALYVGDAASFPAGTPATTANLLDAVAYGLGATRDTDLLGALGQTVQFDEAYRGPSTTQSLGRLNGPLGVPATGLLYAMPPTPGALNASDLTVDETAGVADLPGWRMLSAPLFGSDAEPMQVDDYADINLVQGVAAGAVNPGQYPAVDANIMTGYAGAGSFSPPVDTDEYLLPAQGHFWYWYDLDLIPDDPSGTSRSYDLSNPEFSFKLTGVPMDDSFGGLPYEIPLPVSTDGFYMYGNPFAYPYRAGGASVDAGVLSSNFYLYDPALGTYIVRTANFGDPFAGDALPVWNGAMVEVTAVPVGVTEVFFTTSSAYVDPTAGDTFVGFAGATIEGETRLELALDRVTAGGDAPADRATVLRFREDASMGWDLHDGSKPTPPQPTGLLALVGERDGETRWQAVRSLPIGFGTRVDVPIAFFAAEPGSWRIGLETLGEPQEWGVQLTDNSTGAVIDLEAGSYVFDADAGDWTERFSLAVTQVVVAGAPGPDEAFLSAAAPNPATGRTRLSLTTGAAQRVRADVFDALGRRVATVLDGSVPAGAEREIIVETSTLAPGAYIVRVVGETFSETRRVTVVR